jgi:hypothetical protein
MLSEERSSYDDAHRNYNIALRLNSNHEPLSKAKEALSLRWPDTT